MTHPDFDAVLDLPAHEQRRLLDEGDRSERLWAAWAVALRLGADAVPLLTGARAQRAPAGLRQQLLVVVAGLGEREVLRVLADQDDTPDVRATACAYFIKTAPRICDEETLMFAARHLGSPSKEVREAVLLEQCAGRLRLPDSVVLRALEDPDAGNRALASRCVGKNPALSDATLRALIDALEREPEHHLLREMFGMLPRSAYPAVFARLRSCRLSDILDLAQESAGTLDWSELRVLGAGDDPGVLCRLLRLLRGPLPDEAFVWTARVWMLLSSGQLADQAAHEATWRALSLVRSTLSSGTVNLLDHAAALRLMQTFGEERVELLRVAEYESEGDAEDNIEGRSPVDELRDDIEDLRRCITLLRMHHAPHGERDGEGV